MSSTLESIDAKCVIPFFWFWLFLCVGVVEEQSPCVQNVMKVNTDNEVMPLNPKQKQPAKKSQGGINPLGKSSDGKPLLDCVEKTLIKLGLDVKTIDASSLLSMMFPNGLVGSSDQKIITIHIDLLNRFLHEMNETSSILKTNEVVNTKNQGKKNSKPPKACNVLSIGRKIVTTCAQEKASKKEDVKKKGLGTRSSCKTLVVSKWLLVELSFVWTYG